MHNDSNVTRNVTDNGNDNVTVTSRNALRIEKNKNKIKNRGDLSYSDSSVQDNGFSAEANEAVSMFNNSVRPIKNIDEAERIRAMVDECGLAAFRKALDVVKKKRPRAPFPYLEEVLKNRDGPDVNDPVAGAEAANKILESGEIIDFNSE